MKLPWLWRVVFWPQLAATTSLLTLHTAGPIMTKLLSDHWAKAGDNSRNKEHHHPSPLLRLHSSSGQVVSMRAPGVGSQGEVARSEATKPGVASTLNIHQVVLTPASSPTCPHPHQPLLIFLFLIRYSIRQQQQHWCQVSALCCLVTPDTGPGQLSCRPPSLLGSSVHLVSSNLH